MLTALAAFRADAGYVTVAAPESALPVLEARLLEAVKRPLPEDSSGRLVSPRAAELGARGGRAGGRGRARARARPQRRDARARADPARAARRAGRARRGRALGAGAVRARRADRDDAALRRARPAARSRRARDRRAPARGRPPGRLAVRRGRPAQGRGHARRVAARGRPRRGLRPAVARDRRHGRRADRRDRGVPREGARAAARGGRRRGRPRGRLAPRRAAASASSRATCCRGSSGPSPARAGSSRRSPERGCAARSRSTWARCGATRGGCSTRSAAPSSGRSSRRTGTATAPRDCARAALDAGATALCVATLEEALELRRRLREPRIIVLGLDAAGGDRRGAGGAAGARLPAPRSPRAAGAREARHRHGALGSLRAGDAAAPDVVGLMTHLATADSDLDFARRQLERVPRGDRGLRRVSRATPRTAPPRCVSRSRASTRRAAGSRSTASRRSAADPAADGLEPVLSWRASSRSRSSCTPASRPATARTFVAERDTWIGHRPGRLRRRLPPRPDGDRGARRRRAATGRRHGLDGRLRGRARPRAGRGDAGHDRRAGRAARGARPRRRDDHVRARVADRATGPTRARRVLVDPGRSAPARAEPGARPGERRREERL